MAWGLRSLLLGAIAASGWNALSALPDDEWLTGWNFTGGGISPSPGHRTSGGRAHRKWRQLRSSGRR